MLPLTLAWSLSDMTNQNNALVDSLSALGLSTDVEPAPAARKDNFIAQWPKQSVLRLTGADARKFLQGQLSCQIDNLDTRNSTLAAASTPKGKALANFRLVALSDDEILLRLSADRAMPLLNHFQKYLAFFKAQMEASSDWCLLGIRGAAAVQALGIEWSGAPGEVRSWHQSLLVATLPDAHDGPRFELWLNRADFERFEAQLQSPTATALLSPQSAWLASEIEAGLTVIDETLQDRYVPQFFNWHAVGGISFQKGCYTGQEIIARMHYLGQLKKSTFRVLLPKGGATVLAIITDSSGRGVGEITNLVAFDDGHQEGLAVIQHSAQDAALQIADSAGAPVRIAPLPYTVAEQRIGV